MAMNTLFIPVNIIATATFQIYYSHLTSSNDSRETKNKALKKVTVFLLLASLPMAVFIYIFSPEIYRIVFGEVWINSGKYASALVIWLVFMVINKPIVASLTTIHKQKQLFIYEATGTVVKLFSLAACFYFEYNPMTTIELYSLTSAFFYVILITWGYRELKNHEKEYV
ncbi:hypothetical protein THS27_17605 [Thalassospira sp. MCCC 1A01428]|nr:hypothetical protein THS27_17605 [Thalassospira sp. MCCC 1A01428]